MSDVIGFIGVGTMGSRMAKHLLDNGLDVVAYDVDPEQVEEVVDAGARAGESIAGVAAEADVVMTSLPNSEIVEDVYLSADGIVTSADDGTTLVEMSTVLPSTIEAIAEAVEGRDLHLVDSPVIGPPSDAAAATLTIVVGSDEASFERVKPILSHLCNHLERVGEPGDPKKIKLANNIMTLGNFALAAETFALVDRVGIDPEQFYDIVKTGAGHAVINEAKAPKAFAGDFEPDFTIDMALKDLRYGLAMKDEEQFPAPIAAAVAEQYDLAATVVGSDLDYSALVKAFTSLGE